MKYSGKLGFAETVTEDAPSVFKEHMTERQYYGDVLEYSRQTQSSEKINPDILLNDQLSVVGDPYARENFYNLRYATFMGQRWQVTGVKVQYPRLILTLGGLWNGSTTEG